MNSSGVVRFALWLILTGSAGCDSSPATESGGEPRGDGTSGGPPGDVARPPPPAQPNGIDHVLSTGQSNSVSFSGRPVLTTEQSSGNLMFDTGVMTATACDENGCKRADKPKSFVPLVEGDSYFDYPVETMSSGLANSVSRAMKASGASASVLVSVHGRSGNTYACLRKGGCSFLDGRGYVKAFDDGLAQLEDAKELARAAGRPYRVTGVTVVHGESDHYGKTFPLDGTDGTKDKITNYTEALLEWQRDYEAAIRGVTGQSFSVPLFASQMSNWNDRANSEIPIRQLEAHERSGGKVVLVGPTYVLRYANDCIHFTSESQRRLGEYFAKAYARFVVEGRAWEPLRPVKVSLADNVVVARFVVPKPPLVLDAKRIVDPGNYGFEVVDSNGAPLPIVSVAVTGADTVSITLANGGERPARLRYAFTARPDTCPGPELGPRGNLRDSDDAPSAYGYELFNWAVHFDVSVP